MSKIQKALDAISRSPNSAGDRPTSGRANQEASALPEADRAMRRNELTPDIPEIVPHRSITIDLNALAEAGMFPRRKDVELIAEQFRRVKRPVLRCAFDDSLLVNGNSNVVMMASAMPGAGKSFCAFNLANSIAHERDFGSILVDADILKPGLTYALGLKDQPGLTDYLVDPNLDVADIMVMTDLNGIIVIPTGQKHPEATELLSSRRMRGLVSILLERFVHRAVIVDTPPLLLTNEAQVLAEIAGQIVFVIESRVSLQDSVLRALDMLSKDKPINAILNKSRTASGGGYQSDEYGYYPYIKESIDDAGNR